MNVLFLCTGNSARSILGEYLLRTLSDREITTVSAGAAPTGRVHPMAQKILSDDYGIDSSDASSQPLSDFKASDLDLVITVCGHAQETCPLPPSEVARVHWGSPDPAAVEGSDAEIEAAFRRVARQIEGRVRKACPLLLGGQPPEKLISQLQAIGDTNENVDGG